MFPFDGSNLLYHSENVITLCFKWHPKNLVKCSILDVLHGSEYVSCNLAIMALNYFSA